MKRIIAMALALALSLSLTACSPKVEIGPAMTAESKDRGVTLNVVTSYGGDDGNRNTFESIVERYESVTGNTVNDGSADSNEEWKIKVITDFETGSEPDVLLFFTGADIQPVINAGKVVSIEQIREVYPDYAANMKPSMMAVAEDGKHYAVPAYGYWENMFVNQSVLRACGVEVPGPDYSWEQFLLDCRRILDHGYTPIACSLYEVPHYWFEFALMNNGNIRNHLHIPTVDKSGTLVDDEISRKWIAALEDLKALYQAGFFPRNTLAATDAETVSMFARGEAAFLIDGSWKVGYFTENYPDELENFVVCCVPGKGERSATEAIGGISMGYFITAKAWNDPEKQAAAVQFVSMLTSDEVLSEFVTTEVTALAGGADPSGLNTLQQSAADCNASITGVVGAVQDTIGAEAKRVLFASIQQVVTGQITAAEAVEAAAKLNE